MLRNVALCLLLVFSAAAVSAQDPVPHRYAELDIDSGDVRNASAARATTFSESVRFEGASWLRLLFNQADLGQVTGRGDGTVLRITSLKDGAVQEHTAATLAQWQNSSAFFNGEEVLVELVADPDAPASRIRITEAMVGEPDGATDSICGPVDDRVLSTDARTARVVPVGCTVWLIDDEHGCFLSAGHCTGNLQVVEFNVPLSNANGSLNHPPPEDQYAVDASSLQFDQTVIGNDWAYFGVFPNSETQLTPFEVQGQAFTLGTVPGVAANQDIRITGYGSVDGTQGTPVIWNQVQTTHNGPLTAINGTALQYQVDTTGGDSGSCVLNQDNGTAIGIHTNAGCGAGGGANSGTGLNNAGLQNALANPIGICAGGPRPLRIELVDEIADPMPPAGMSFQVDILERDGSAPVLESANLIYDAGAGDQTVPLTSLGGTLYEANLPAIDCGSEVTFRVEAEDDGVVVGHPFSAVPSVDRRYRRHVTESFDATFRDNFETDMGWTVDNDASLTAGAWERALPAGYGLREDPPWDADSSGQCYVTQAPGGNTDVDGGASRLISPAMDATVGADPHITYWRWWADAGDSDDTFTVEISDNDGASWVTLETIGPNVIGAWVRQTFRVADFVSLTDQIRLRFTVSDLGEGDIVEAGVDGVALYNTLTGLSCDVIFADGFESGNTSAW
ncbi:MAG: hypothetical protein AAF657_00565 [Acidobacteriota bacterium]